MQPGSTHGMPRASLHKTRWRWWRTPATGSAESLPVSETQEAHWSARSDKPEVEPSGSRGAGEVRGPVKGVASIPQWTKSREMFPAAPCRCVAARVCQQLTRVFWRSYGNLSTMRRLDSKEGIILHICLSIRQRVCIVTGAHGLPPRVDIGIGHPAVVDSTVSPPS